MLPEAFLTFATKSSIGPSYAAHGPYTLCTLRGTSDKSQLSYILRSGVNLYKP